VRVLLLSAYAAQSHVYWHDNLVRMFPDWQWHILSLPPRHFSWRVRGNPLYWALEERARLEGEYDLLVATSMVDLATLRGLVPSLAALPTVLYFHENQFAYPQNQQKHTLLEAQMVSLYSALAADNIVFNSAYNQGSFLNGCEELLKRLPDKVPGEIVPSLLAKSLVIPVPLRDADPDSREGVQGMGASSWGSDKAGFPQRPLRLLWVGRFEHDKGGDNLLLILRILERQGFSYKLALVGQQFRNSPAAFEKIQIEFKHRLLQFGYIESRQAYREMLSGADVILSTALHEFQGLAVLEAVAAGCLPAVPHRLVYPEILPPENCYPSCPGDADKEAEGAAWLIRQLARHIESGGAELPDISAFTSELLAPQYEALFESVCLPVG
jgi:glycosyltransferase involved in cell wall biosynthesis